MDQQAEWLTSNIHISFPFEGPVAAAIKERIVDAAVIDPSTAVENILLREITVDAGSSLSAIDVVYTPSLNNFFAGTPDSQTSIFGDWIAVQYSEQSTGKSVTLLLNGKIVALPETIPAIAGIFVQKCVDHPAPVIKSFRVKDYLNVTHTLTGDVDFVAGYNVALGLEDPEVLFDDSDRTAIPIQLSAVPGSGLGLYPNGCAGDTYLRTINGIGPDQYGRFKLGGENCHRVWIPGSDSGGDFVPVPYTLEIANGCRICCECEDYGNCYKALDRLYQMGTNVGKGLKKTKDDLDDLNDGIGFERAKRVKRRFRMFLRPTPGYILGVQLLFTNNPPNNPIELKDHPVFATLSAANSEVVDDAHCTVRPTFSCHIRNERYEDHRILDRANMFNLFTTTYKPPNLKILPNDPDTYSTGLFYDHLLGGQYGSAYFEIHFMPDDKSGVTHEHLVDGYQITVALTDPSNYWFAPDDTHTITQIAKLRQRP